MVINNNWHAVTKRLIVSIDQIVIRTKNEYWEFHWLDTKSLLSSL